MITSYLLKIKQTVTQASFLVVTTLSLLMTGCGNEPVEPETTDSGTQTLSQQLDALIGCYTVSHGEPAQIKVAKLADGFVMQMKEPASSGRVWDEPEPLETVALSQARSFFSIDPNNIDAMLARPDRVLVLAHVKSVYANIDPLLDSEYLSYIYQGANTIYKVECDDINTDILADPHANIAIDQIESPDSP